MTTISIDTDNWKKLNVIKLRNNFRNLNEVVVFLLDNEKKFKKLKVDEGGK